MTNFHGFCSYPHGGWVMVGLLASTFSALAATMWGVSSCRYFFIDFQSDRGDFTEMYFDPTPDVIDPVLYRAGAGLFTWLTPFDTIDWSDGQCTGYNQIQLSYISDTHFEISRIFAVLSVLMGCGISIWTLFLSCLSLTRFQIILMSICFLSMTIFTSLTNLIFMSHMCSNEFVSFQSDTYTATCTLDQGGLVVIASSILWCVSFLVTIIYIKPPEADMAIVNGQIQNVFVERMETRKKQLRDKQLQKLMADQQHAKLASMKRQEQLDATGPSKRGDVTKQQQQELQQQHLRQLRQQADLHLSRTGSMTPPPLKSPRGGQQGGTGGTSRNGRSPASPSSPISPRSTGYVSHNILNGGNNNNNRRRPDPSPRGSGGGTHDVLVASPRGITPRNLTISPRSSSSQQQQPRTPRMDAQEDGMIELQAPNSSGSSPKSLYSAEI